METQTESKSNNDHNAEMFMLTVKGLEKYAQREIEQLLKPASVRIIPGIIITNFNTISPSLMKRMRSLRSVSKIICLVDELYDVPLKQQDIEQYLDEKVLKITNEIKIKWETAYICWKYSCCHNTLFTENPSIPFKTKTRFQKEIDKLKQLKNDNTQSTTKNRDKLHEMDINLNNPVYRSKCNRKGQHQWSSLLMEKEIAAPLHDVLGFDVNLKYYDIELYCFVRDSLMLYGISIVSDLNVRNRISLSYSTILNNNICFLVAQLADIKDNMVIWDPMCGVGSTVIEWKLAFDEYKRIKYIGSDINDKAIKQAMLNAEYCDIKVNENMNEVDIDFKDCSVMQFYKLDICDVTQKEIGNECVDIIVSDLPFGHRCGSHKKNRKTYPLMLQTINRILKVNGKAFLITMERKLLAKLLDENDKQWKYDTLEIDVGGFDALLFVIHKVAVYQDIEENSKETQIDVKNNDIHDANDENDQGSDGNSNLMDYRKMSLDSQ